MARSFDFPLTRKAVGESRSAWTVRAARKAGVARLQGRRVAHLKTKKYVVYPGATDEIKLSVLSYITKYVPLFRIAAQSAKRKTITAADIATVMAIRGETVFGRLTPTVAAAAAAPKAESETEPVVAA